MVKHAKSKHNSIRDGLWSLKITCFWRKWRWAITFYHNYLYPFRTPIKIFQNLYQNSPIDLPRISHRNVGHCLLVFRSRGARRAREAREARRARGARPWGPWGPWSPSSPWGPWGQGRVNECLLFSGLLLRTPLCDCWCPNLPVSLPGQCVDPSQCRIEC